MSPGGISVLERGIRRSPQRDTVAQLAEALHLSAGDRERLEAAAARPQRPRRRKTMAPASHNLRIELTSFIGREEVLAEIESLVHQRPLVTLVGTGGIGKTRCALHVAAHITDTFADGAWLVELAPIADASLVASTIAQALGVRLLANQPPLDTVVSYLKRKKVLLVLDNCEHVVDEARNVATAILRACPDVRILATSREALHIAGETVYRMPSLELVEAVTLFADRALSIEKRFALSDKSRPHVEEICVRLDRIPLAIELAAARVDVLPPAQLVQRLDERFRVLTVGDRSALPRHQTMRALIDWSYDLLTDDEQRVFRALSIFAGGCTLQSAAAVCARDELAVLERLSSLVEKSLLQAEPSESGTRYHFLESVRQYASERLDALEGLGAPGEREAAARRHAEYFRDQAIAADERYGTGPISAWLAGAELELDNYRAALTWALMQGNDSTLGAAIAGALVSLWTNGGLTIEGRDWIERALAAVSDAEQPRIAATLNYALSLFSSGTQSHDAAARAMQLYASLGDAQGAARARHNAAFAIFQMGELDAAYAAITQALAAARACEDVLSAAHALNLQAMIETQRGNIGAARDGYAQALAAFKALGNETGAARVLGNLAESQFADGDPEQALRSVSEALEINRRGKNATSIATDYTNGAAYRLALGDLAGARESARKALRVARQGRVELSIAIALQHLALLAAVGSDAPRAAMLLGYVDACFTELGIKREFTEQWGYDKLIVALHAALEEDEIARRSAEGADWDEDYAVMEALKV